MKKLSLTIFFIFYILFMPFIMVNCSVADDPYNRLDDDGSTGGGESNLTRCQSQEYVTLDCVSVLQADEERLAADAETIETAALATADLVECPDLMAAAALVTASGGSSTGGTTTGTSTEEVIDCDATITTIADGIETCEAQDIDDNADNCELVTDTFNTMIFKCDQLIEKTFRTYEENCSLIKPQESLDFCASLAVSVYDLCHNTSGAVVTSFLCEVTDHIQTATRCECSKTDPAISDSVCTDVNAKTETAEEGDIGTN